MWVAKFELELYRNLTMGLQGLFLLVSIQHNHTRLSLCHNFIEQVGVTQVISLDSNIVEKSAIRGLWSLSDSLIGSVTGLHEKS